MLRRPERRRRGAGHAKGDVPHLAARLVAQQRGCALAARAQRYPGSDHPEGGPVRPRVGVILTSPTSSQRNRKEDPHAQLHGPLSPDQSMRCPPLILLSHQRSLPRRASSTALGCVSCPPVAPPRTESSLPSVSSANLPPQSSKRCTIDGQTYRVRVVRQHPLSSRARTRGSLLY